MRSRVLTALALTALLVVAILFSPPGVTAAILGLILLIGAWEWSAFLALALPWRLTYVLALGLLAYAGWRYTPEAAPFRLMLQLAIAWWLIALVWIVCAPQRGGRAAAAWLRARARERRPILGRRRLSRQTRVTKRAPFLCRGRSVRILPRHASRGWSRVGTPGWP